MKMYEVLVVISFCNGIFANYLWFKHYTMYIISIKKKDPIGCSGMFADAVGCILCIDTRHDDRGCYHLQLDVRRCCRKQ